jgi:hypothetical protein
MKNNEERESYWKEREELLSIIQPLYAATPMHSIGVNFIVDFLLMHPSVALECIRVPNVFDDNDIKD